MFVGDAVERRYRDHRTVGDASAMSAVVKAGDPASKRGGCPAPPTISPSPMVNPITVASW